jgi:hypothetical protein
MLSGDFPESACQGCRRRRSACPWRSLARFVHGRYHQVERVRCAGTVRRGIGQRADDLQLLDDRAGPSVRDDERQCVVMAGADVNEMNVEPVDLGHEVRQGVQPGLASAPVVICRPVAREFLNHRQRNALRIIRDRFPLGPLRRVNAPAQFGKLRCRDIHPKRADSGPAAARLPSASGHDSDTATASLAPFQCGISGASAALGTVRREIPSHRRA